MTFDEIGARYFAFFRADVWDPAEQTAILDTMRDYIEERVRAETGWRSVVEWDLSAMPDILSAETQRQFQILDEWRWDLGNLDAAKHAELRRKHLLLEERFERLFPSDVLFAVLQHDHQASESLFRDCLDTVCSFIEEASNEEFVSDPVRTWPRTWRDSFRHAKRIIALTRNLKPIPAVAAACLERIHWIWKAMHPSEAAIALLGNIEPMPDQDTLGELYMDIKALGQGEENVG